MARFIHASITGENRQRVIDEMHLFILLRCPWIGVGEFEADGCEMREQQSKLRWSIVSEQELRRRRRPRSDIYATICFHRRRLKSTRTSKNAAQDATGVTLKCLSHEKSAREEIITNSICLPLLKYRRPHKKSPHYRIAPEVSSRPTIYRQKSVPPGRPPCGRIFAGKLSAGGDFSGGDSIVGHRRATELME